MRGSEREGTRRLRRKIRDARRTGERERHRELKDELRRALRKRSMPEGVRRARERVADQQRVISEMAGAQADEPPTLGPAPELGPVFPEEVARLKREGRSARE